MGVGHICTNLKSGPLTELSNSDLGKRIRIARRRLDVPVEELAVKSDVSISRLLKLESGLIRINAIELYKIAQGLGVSMEEFFD